MIHCSFHILNSVHLKKKFIFLFQLHPWPMEVSGQGIKFEPHLWLMPQVQQCQLDP